MLHYLDTIITTFIMKFFCILSIWITLLILRCFAERSNAELLSSLSRVCVFYFPFDKNDSSLTPPNNVCTAVSTCSEYGPHPPPKDFKIDPYKEFMSYVYIYDEKKYSEMKENVHKDEVQSFVDHLNTLINDHKIDVMVFNFLFLVEDEEIDNEFQNNLKLFFEKMKTSHRNMLFGLKIHRDAEVNKKLFNPVVIDGCIDFYVVNSYDYHRCVYEKSQKDMAPPPSKDDLTKTINDLTLSGYNEKKLFLTIEIDVKSWKNDDADFPEDWSYSWMCHADPGKKRRYCRGCLENFYDQGQLISSYNLPGVFIQAVDFDDFTNDCKCGFLPASQAIYDGLMGIPKNKTNINCHRFGLLQKEL